MTGQEMLTWGSSMRWVLRLIETGMPNGVSGVDQQFSFCHGDASAAASEVTDRHGRQSYGRPYRVENVTRAG